MKRGLILFLLATASLTLIVHADPELVISGLVYFLLPGIILAIAPTLFLWVMTWTIFWLLARKFLSRWPAVIAGLVLAGGVLTGASYLLNMPVERQLDELTAHNFRPEHPIRMSGTVLLDFPRRYVRTTKEYLRRDGKPTPVRVAHCDAFCAGLLFSKGIDAVIVKTTNDNEERRTLQPLPQAAQYRLSRAPDCDGSVMPAPESGIWLSESNPKMRKLFDGWLVRLAGGECIRRETVTMKPDRIISLRERAIEETAPWSLALPRPGFIRLEIRDAAQNRLSSTTWTKARFFRQPLAITVGAFGPPALDWATKTREEPHPRHRFREVAYITDVTDLHFEPPSDSLSGDAKSILREALNDTSLSASAPALALTSRVLSGMKEYGLQKGDKELVIRILADDRTHGLMDLQGVVQKLGDEAPDLRAPIVERILRQTCPGADLTWLGEALRAMPEGTFATLTDLEKRLLDDQAHLRCAGPLVARLADMGADATPLLLTLLERGLSPPGMGSVVNNAKQALTVLGPRASSALPVIEKMEDEGVISDSIMLRARLGKPVSSFEKPDNYKGTTESYHQRLQHQLDDLNRRYGS